MRRRTIGRQLKAPLHARALLSSLLLLGGIGVAQAQECPDWDRPVVCEIELYGAFEGRSPAPLVLDQPIELMVGQQLELRVGALDQSGRPFPAERLRFGLELDRGCRDLVEVEESGDARYRLQAGSRHGECRIWLWVPGNLNLEWPVDVRVAPRSAGDYSRAEAEFITTCLYRALLGRDPDPTGLTDKTAEIQRGNLEQQVRAMASGSEFSKKAADLTPAQLLDQIYEGIFGRKADSGGVRGFLGQIERGQVGDVVWRLLQSEEFQTRLQRETAKR